MSATLGGLIKDYRLQKGLSQIEIAFALGWKEASRLSRIERGKVGKPPRRLVEEILDILELEKEEKNNVLLVGNYLPNKADIKKIRKLTDTFINKLQYPAVVYDFSWRIIHQNRPNIKVFRKSKEELEWIQKKTPRIFEIEFSEESLQNVHLKGKDLKKWHDTLRDYLVQFKYVQRSRTKERWYIDAVKKMMDNDLFRELWNKAKESNYNKLVRAYGIVKAVPPNDPDKVLTFEVFNGYVVKDPRFEIEFHMPADLKTFEYFQKR